MKKLFFLCSFLFISTQVQAQLYIVKGALTNSYTDINDPLSVLWTYSITIASPDGSSSTIEVMSGGSEELINNTETAEILMQSLNTELNNIINQGYKLIHVIENPSVYLAWNNGTYYLAVPWTAIGLTEIDSSNLDLRISPNPANDYINVEVDFKSQPNEIVLISEQGYVYFRKDISNIKSGQEFTLDISNIPAGKYLVTVKNEKEYLTPQKLVIF